MSGVETKIDEEIDGWPTNTTEVSLGAADIISHLHKMALAPDYTKSPEARADFAKAAINRDIAKRMSEYYRVTGDERISAEAHEHFQWAQDLVADDPLQNARICHGRSVLYHFQSAFQPNVAPLPQLEHELRLTFGYAERLGRRDQKERLLIADRVHVIAEANGIDLSGSGEAKMAAIEARLWAMGNPTKALGAVAAEQVTEVLVTPQDDPWLPTRVSHWAQFDTTELSEPLTAPA